MLIDTHAHLDYEYDLSLEDLLAEAAGQEVKTVVAIAAEPGSLERVREIAEKFPNVYFTTGIHPHDAEKFSAEIERQMAALAKHEKCVAIGELGLDYYYNHSDKTAQHAVLNRQLEFSVQVGKPIVFHSRDAEADTISLLKPHATAWREKGHPPGVIHCFTGSKYLAEECLALGYCLSFSGIITFKNAEPLREVVKMVPLDRILVETDSPYLAPVPHRGKKNHPAYTRIVAERVAELRGLSLAEVASRTTENARRLFQI